MKAPHNKHHYPISEPPAPTNAEQEQLSNYIFAYWRQEQSRLEASENLARLLLSLGYHRRGVLVAQNQGKPAFHWPGLETTNEQYQRGVEDGYRVGQNSMVSAGFRRVEEIA